TPGWRCGLSLPQFKLLRSRTLAEAVDLLATHTARVGTGALARPASAEFTRASRPYVSQVPVRIIAGGTDLIPSMQQKLFEPEYVLDLRGIAEMRGIRPQADGGVEIGALTTVSTVEKSDFLRRHYPVLTEAASTIASPILRNMGTIGGNICLDTRCHRYN